MAFSLICFQQALTMEGTEKQIVLKLRAGNHFAFEHFVRDNYNPVFYLCLGITKSRETSEELTSDIFLKIWNKRESLPLSGSLQAYLRVVSRNAAIDFVRSRKFQLVSIEDIESFDFTSSEVTDNTLIEAEMKKAYQDALDSLTPRRKEIFKLSREENLTYEEIAQKLNISKNTVEVQMGFALRGLKNFVRQKTDLKVEVWILLLHLFNL
ncbi:MAG: hypothetical protein CMI36_04185 [Owenweeksia sp.]|nr:hypothetical protein [Owenweeksia sp.]MBF98168.1 hypothetical protein [Owenweeksia sp.]HCQ16270.1 hypothetical protein [Cryomorphaceae bacterium]|tara:strand:+ start:1418 stop:2047 length:630 start_codon:yes stop_codon:yes gene_type:complete